MNYTNAQLRSILNGLGHREKTSADDSNFPLTTDSSALVDALTIKAIKTFQQEYELKVDGIAGPKTMAKVEYVMKVLQDELKIVVKASLPSNQPYYGQYTIAAVKKFQVLIKVQQDGIANKSVRIKLYDATQAASRI